MEQIVKMKQLTQLDLASELTKTIQASGQNVEEEDFKAMVIIFDEDLKKDYSFLEWPEIKIALHNGVRNRYGKYYGINVTTLCSWIDSYLDSPDRDIYLQNKQVVVPVSCQLSEKNELSELDKEQLSKEIINRSYSRYLQSIKAPKKEFNLGRNIKSLQSFITVTDYGGSIKRQLVREGKMEESQALIDFYSDCCKKGITKIYD